MDYTSVKISVVRFLPFRLIRGLLQKPSAFWAYGADFTAKAGSMDSAYSMLAA